MNVAIQSYNYGGGYVGYVAGKGKKHTYNLAESFAREKSGGKKVTYTNPIAVVKKWWLALPVWQSILCGISQSVFNCSAGIGRAGTKGNE
uniref:Cell wall hydrolase n=1 Tax=Clostridioides difficile TaxID=1496 RepID=A0A381KMX6_CLODI|nr:cell wall hydrolase [Clostridioides difficile]